MEMPSGRRSSLPGPPLQGQRQRAEQGRSRRHHDRPEPQQTRLVNRFFRTHPFIALRVEGEVDHHDCVLLHDADEEDDSNQRDEGKISPAKDQGDQCSDARAWQCRQNRDRMDVTLVENAKDDVDDDDSRKNEVWLAR